ncbi:serine/threonine-protein kinase [Stieleria varia]
MNIFEPFTSAGRRRRLAASHGSSRKTSGRRSSRIHALGDRGHMTWASHSFAGSVSRTRDFFAKRYWLWPVIAIVLLSSIAYAVHRSIATTMQQSLQSELQTLLDVEVAMLETWLESQERNTESAANESEIRALTAELVDSIDLAERGLMNHSGATIASATPAIGAENAGDSKSQTASGPDRLFEIRTQLARRLGPAMSTQDYIGFAVIDRKHRVLASNESTLIGTELPVSITDALTIASDGDSTITRPYLSAAPLQDNDGVIRTGVPTMLALAPIRNEQFQTIATLAFRIRPGRDFTRILQLGRIGQSGETYAFDKEGVMLSNSRFDDDLVLLGLLPDQESVRSLLKLLVRDPGGDITQGHRPSQRRSELPLTLMAATAASGSSGVNVSGYRDYRGVSVVGAWTWLSKYNFGVTTETDFAEAYRPLVILQRTFWALIALLILTSIAILVFSIMVGRLHRKAQEAAIEAKQLGQYRLEEKIGEGAMGVVYKGQHAMLRRPTAIKLLNVSKVSDRSIARFEREVQITSRLTHPNTVAIYDYGRTPEGVFYYAMEYLEGIELQELVDEHGPQSPGRVIHVLRQICGSLFEAHTSGLVHRDIKPANIMLNRRGGESDVVKVLDFGLVKAIEESDGEDGGFAGTPLYVSPEGIQMPSSVDAQSDLYAVGAVGYFMLTGRPVFDAESFGELCQKHIAEMPTPPSQIDGIDVPEDLESLLLACLEKSRGRRPQSARELAIALSHCRDANAWGIEQADLWWTRQERGLVPSSLMSRSQMNSDQDSSSLQTPLSKSSVSATGSAQSRSPKTSESQSERLSGGERLSDSDGESLGATMDV